ncbi:MAG: aminotransferase class V-fold PLP-dependent enzyme [Albidovulum sp.]
MTLTQGRPYLAIPGPSVVPDRVLRAMHRASPNIYEGEIIDTTAKALDDLRRIAFSTSHVAIYVGNGHAGWEAANANVFSRGDKALAVITGQFGINWTNSVRRMAVDVEELNFGRRSPADPAKIAEVLDRDKAHEIRAVLVTHVDTASSVRNDIAAIRAAMDASGHPALLMVDGIASLGCDEFRMDAWGVDVYVAASQKGLMLPPGLAFLWFSDKAREASKRADWRTPYWDWEPRVFGPDFSNHFCGTAPTHHLFGLRESLSMILDEEGIENVWARHRVLAGAVWAAFGAWAKGSDIGINIADAATRAHAVTAARIGDGNAGRLRNWCEQEAGVTLGVGLGMALSSEPAYQDFLRVAHMGHVNAHMTLGVLAAMQAGMVALDIAHGPGALEAATLAVALTK